MATASTTITFSAMLLHVPMRANAAFYAGHTIMATAIGSSTPPEKLFTFCRHSQATNPVNHNTIDHYAVPTTATRAVLVPLTRAAAGLKRLAAGYRGLQSDRHGFSVWQTRLCSSRGTQQQPEANREQWASQRTPCSHLWWQGGRPHGGEQSEFKDAR